MHLSRKMQVKRLLGVSKVFSINLGHLMVIGVCTLIIIYYTAYSMQCSMKEKFKERRQQSQIKQEDAFDTGVNLRIS